MCNRKPLPRCSGHAREDLERATNAAGPQLAYAPAQTLAKYTKSDAHAEQAYALLVARMDYDASPAGLAALAAAEQTPDVMWRRAAAEALNTSRKEQDKLMDDPPPQQQVYARAEWSTLADTRVELAHAEAICAAEWATGHQPSADSVRRVRDAADNVVTASARYSLSIYDGPIPWHAEPEELETWKAARNELLDTPDLSWERETELIVAAHRAAYPSHVRTSDMQWSSPHRSVDARPLDEAAPWVGNGATVPVRPLDVERLHLLTGGKVSWRNGAVTIVSNDPEAVTRLWRTGYATSSDPAPGEPITVVSAPDLTADWYVPTSISALDMLVPK